MAGLRLGFSVSFDTEASYAASDARLTPKKESERRGRLWELVSSIPMPNTRCIFMSSRDSSYATPVPGAQVVHEGTRQCCGI